MSDREFPGCRHLFVFSTITLVSFTIANMAVHSADDLSLPKGSFPPASLPTGTTNAANIPLSGRPATVQKIISEILGSDVAFAKDARDLLIDCCVEFITLISSEANDIAEREAKKTIASEHVVKALKDLGFEEYIDQILEVATEHKEHQKVKFVFMFSASRHLCVCVCVLGGSQS